MERSGCRALVVFSILFGVLGTGAATASKTGQRTRVPAVFAFGDSLLDSGTNNFIEGSSTRADFPPYGETFFHWPTGRFTNGRHTIDFIVSRLGLPFMLPFLNPNATFYQGVNFGSAGSGVLSTTGGDGIIPLGTQVHQFQQVAAQLTGSLGRAAASDLISNSLFIIVIGSNDLSAYVSNATLQHSLSPTQFVTIVLSQLQADIQTLHAFGARKVVVFAIGPLGCAPLAMAGGNATNGQCVAAPNQLAQTYNEALLQLLSGLNSKLPDLRTVTVNTFDVVEGLVKNGTALGFRKGSNACCGTGPFNGDVRCATNNTTKLCKNVKEFVFWDNLHPTERVCRYLAKLAWEGDSSIVQPMNLKTLAQL